MQYLFWKQPGIRSCALTLALLVFGVGFTVDVDAALAANNIAVSAVLLDGGSDLHATGLDKKVSGLSTHRCSEKTLHGGTDKRPL